MPAEPQIRCAEHEEVADCRTCHSDTFLVIYDRKAMGYHVECMSCGAVFGGIR